MVNAATKHTGFWVWPHSHIGVSRYPIVDYLGDTFREVTGNNVTRDAIEKAYDFVLRQSLQWKEQKNTELAFRYALLRDYFHAGLPAWASPPPMNRWMTTPRHERRRHPLRLSFVPVPVTPSQPFRRKLVTKVAQVACGTEEKGDLRSDRKSPSINRLEVVGDTGLDTVTSTV